MKIRRNKDGKVYQVHQTAAITVAGVDLAQVDYLVSGDDENQDDVLLAPGPARPGRIWLDGYACAQVPDSTPVDVP